MRRVENPFDSSIPGRRSRQAVVRTYSSSVLQLEDSCRNIRLTQPGKSGEISSPTAPALPQLKRCWWRFRGK